MRLRISIAFERIGYFASTGASTYWRFADSEKGRSRKRRRARRSPNANPPIGGSGRRARPPGVPPIGDFGERSETTAFKINDGICPSAFAGVPTLDARGGCWDGCRRQQRRAFSPLPLDGDSGAAVRPREGNAIASPGRAHRAPSDVAKSRRSVAHGRHFCGAQACAPSYSGAGPSGG